MSKISKNLIKDLAEMSKIDLEEENYTDDFKEIINYFDKLEEVDTEGVEETAGGSIIENVFRNDETQDKRIPPEKGIKDFPETDDGFLKIPSVFN
ncbi:MAG: Asp-tRNA(Asn)/Glu-tRNA(Gln) amidotransferase subunit GatC [Candidatus Magasanikbacteria bacterium]